MTRLLLSLMLLSVIASTHAFERVQVAENIYALVGDLGQRSEDNLGHNMTSGFIVADDGVIVIEAGASWLGAEAIHKSIKEVSDKPVKWVINSGGQDHKWLGNAYFIEQGATVIASERGKQDMQDRGDSQVAMSKKYLKDKFAGTEIAYPQQTFGQRYRLPIKDMEVELIYLGGGHTPGDIVVWLPKQSILFTGDIVFTQRLLGIMPNSGLKWIESLVKIRDQIKPRIVVPGHGEVTDLDRAMRDSYDYLVLLRDYAVDQFDQDAFDPVEAIDGLDQSHFSYLQNYSDLSFRSRNALNMATEIYESQE
ncbi:MAG: MBL fold metallo-hydrolase [Gammaproteobacteria bacterium]|nr:MBL fold metallo-hydrolase [Gammaproteobacteria bacterium]